MKRILCARQAELWHGLSSSKVELVGGPAGDEPWEWRDSPESFDGIFCSTLPENLNAFTRLRWVQIDSSGFSQLIPADLPARGVEATNAAGVFDIPIAEWCLTMMVALARDLPAMVRNQEETVWDRASRFQTEIRGATVGFWGYGGLARETARLARAFGLRVHVMARGEPRKRTGTFVVPGTGDRDALLPERVFRASQWREFLGGLDFLVMALPLTEATRGICGCEQLRALRSTAYLLNPARGPLIVESALLAALGEGWFAGAALDTHYAYPLPPSHPLWKMPRVILTPHISGSTGSPGYLGRVREIFSSNVERFAGGRHLLNRVPPEDLTPVRVQDKTQVHAATRR